MLPPLSDDASGLVRSIEERFSASPEEKREIHEGLLPEITSRALGSAVYSGRIWTTRSFDELGRLPLTDYHWIHECMARHGKEKCLLAPSVVAFRTSGSTGDPKEFFYGEEDIERILSDYRLYTHMIGFRKGMAGWNLSGAPPDVSGYIVDKVKGAMAMGGPTTLLKDDRDLVRALKEVSKQGRIDMVASGALIVYLVGKMSREPDFLPGIIVDKIVRTYHLPRPLARLVAKLYLRGIDADALSAFADDVSLGITFAESLDAYQDELDRCYPKLRLFDIYGSTENPLMAGQIVHGVRTLGVMTGTIIPELIPAGSLNSGHVDDDRPPSAVPWYEWKAGMKGELVITRPGQCLPLVRYPTGDLIEVLDPARTDRVTVLDARIDICLPHIRVLGRTADTLDYGDQDESGNFMGVKIYSRFVNETLYGKGGVKWWELYNVRDSPARLVMAVIPEKEPLDRARFGAEVKRRLLGEQTDVPQMFEIACDLRRFDIIVLRANAYDVIQAEIDRRVKAGRSIGQMKPKHIYKVDGMQAFREVMRERYEYELPLPSELPLPLEPRFGVAGEQL